MTCERCRELCEEEDREFECQAREPCEELSPENRQALDIYWTWQALGAEMTWNLFDMEMTPEQLEGLRLRLLTCAELWHAERPHQKR